HPRQPQARRARGGARHHDHQLSAVDDRPRHDHQARGPRRPRRAQGARRLDDHVPLPPRTRVHVAPVAVGPGERVPEPLRRVEPHPALQATGVHRASRLHPDRMPARRLPAPSLRRRAPVEGRDSRDGAQVAAASTVGSSPVVVDGGPRAGRSLRPPDTPALAEEPMRFFTALVATALLSIVPGFAAVHHAAAAPEGTMTWGVHITLASRWLDPGDVEGIATPFMVLYA